VRLHRAAERDHGPVHLHVDRHELRVALRSPLTDRIGAFEVPHRPRVLERDMGVRHDVLDPRVRLRRLHHLLEREQRPARGELIEIDQTPERNVHV